MGSPMCRPVFVEEAEEEEQEHKQKGDVSQISRGPVLDVRNMRHPCLQHISAVSDFIPNDTQLGGESARTMILTGPNMGGKSTLLRQTCIAVIMAQLGCWVPAIKPVLKGNSKEKKSDQISTIDSLLCSIV
eukprot:m.189979 g.189979  ORF g.189979 m.189979 type:complete len:131 (-) comp16750_c0_seq3:39-431(-)